MLILDTSPQRQARKNGPPDYEHIRVREKWVDGCYAWADAVIADRDKRQDEELQQSAGKRRIDADRDYQAKAKICEVVGAFKLGIPPTALDWSIGKSDTGHDFVYRGMRIDVKGSWSQYHTDLIWPFYKNDMWDEKQLDVLLSVWLAPDQDRAELRGWKTKWAFELHRQISPGGPRQLDKGTWFVPLEQLERMANLHLSCATE